jgi:hypothetical protein
MQILVAASADLGTLLEFQMQSHTELSGHFSDEAIRPSNNTLILVRLLQGPNLCLDKGSHGGCWKPPWPPSTHEYQQYVTLQSQKCPDSYRLLVSSGPCTVIESQYVSLQASLVPLD